MAVSQSITFLTLMRIACVLTVIAAVNTFRQDCSLKSTILTLVTTRLKIRTML